MPKIIFILVSLGFFLHCSEQKKQLQPPSNAKIAEYLTLTFEAGTISAQHPYAFTDQVGGFWQGHLFGHNSPNTPFGGFGGYTLNSHRVLADVMMLQGNRTISRQDASHVFFRPHQLVHVWDDDCRETITILDRRPGMIIQLQAPAPAEYQVQPIFHPQTRVTVSQVSPNAVLFHDTVSGQFLLFSGNSPLTWQKHSNNLDAEWGERQPHGVLALGTGKNHTLSLCLGYDRADVIAAAETMDPAGEITKKLNRVCQPLRDSWFRSSDPEFDKAIHWAKLSGQALVVQEFGLGIWAGLPWFDQNWGRDTFIALPGISLVTGQYQQAKNIITGFTQWQQTRPNSPLWGRIPNRVNSPEDIIYNTADGTPWLIREVLEYLDYSGDMEFAEAIFPAVKLSIQGALANQVDNAGYLVHEDADTWMDARIRGREAWSPRGNRAVEIQALWYNQLLAGIRLAELTENDAQIPEWQRIAEKLRRNFNRDFVNAQASLSDHLNEDGTPDKQVRPNQLLAITVPRSQNLIPLKIQAKVVAEATEKLAFEYGIASLDPDDPNFHPLHHDQIFHFDAAYHNGLCWQWNTGHLISGLVKFGQENTAFRMTQNLANQILTLGMPGSLSELVLPIVDDTHPLKISGTYSQAWSVSEFVRNFYQDYLGIHPHMLSRDLRLAPHLPKHLPHVELLLPIGANEKLGLFIERQKNGYQITIDPIALTDSLTIHLESAMAAAAFDFDLRPGQAAKVRLRTNDVMLNRQKQPYTRKLAAVPEIAVDFRQPQWRNDWKSMQIPNYLENKILNQKVKK